MNKRDLLEEKQRRWMEERKKSQYRETNGSEIKQSTLVQSSNAAMISRPSVPSSTSSPSSLSEEKLIDKLTEKLAGHIRDEIKKEMKGSLHRPEIRDVVADQMETYLQAELHTHMCKICSKLMTGPESTPIILFPCGHTFCKACVTTCKRKSSHCPYCRTPIESSAVNQSLKTLIDQFVEKRNQVTGGKADMLADVFAESNLNGDVEDDAAAVNASRERSKFAAMLQSLEMRKGIVLGELEETKAEATALHRRREAVDTACTHLKKEAASVERRLQQLQEEKELVLSHLAEQQNKRTEVDASDRMLQHRMEVMKKTLRDLEVEADKIRILSEGVAKKR